MTKKTVLIVVDSDGELIVSANGQISSDNRELVKRVKQAAEIRRRVQLVAPFGNKVTASLEPDNLLGLTAALFAANPGRTTLIEAPEEVTEWIAKESEAQAGGCRKLPPSSMEDFKVPDLHDSNNPYAIRDMLDERRRRGKSN